MKKIKIRAEINEIKTRKTIEKKNKTNIWFFEQVNKIGKPSARLTKKKREKTQISKIRNESEDITTDCTEIKRIVKEYCEQLYANKLDNLDGVDKVLGI